MRTAIIIPAFNEAATIAEVVRGAAPFGTVVVVDDHSSDETGKRALSAGAEVVSLSENHGYEGALQEGFERAAKLGAEIVATIDADGQHDAATLESILAPIREGKADLVLGARPHAARFSEWLFGRYTRLRFGVDDILCGMKAYRIELFHDHGCFDATRSVGTELALAGLRRKVRFAVVPVPVRPRGSGKSRYGSFIRPNLRILRAMVRAMIADLGKEA